MEIFNACKEISDLILSKKENDARNELIKLLDHHKKNNIQYSELINHLIRETGLYPYLNLDTASWQEKYIHEAFKVDTGSDNCLTLHREQSRVLKKLLDGNSIAVSAPTSFGKSFIIDAFISIKRPTNVVIIVPTIALMDETRRRLYKKFASTYKIITTAEVEPSSKNIFIFPQERAINYVDKIENLDILIIDEFYKASSQFDKDRSGILIKAIIRLGSKAQQRYFLAPNISVIKENPFTQGMETLYIDFNTVFLNKIELYKDIKEDKNLKNKKLVEILQKNQTKTLVYAGTYTNISYISQILLDALPEKNKLRLNDFSNWLQKNYSLGWKLPDLIKKGIGIHNGRLHRSLSQIQVKLFEEETEGLDNIISTSSIIEGINTSAENVVIWTKKNGRSNFDNFTCKNLMGRSGRMFKYFIGNVYLFEQPPADRQTELDIQIPLDMLGSMDYSAFQKDLTKEQLAKIILFKKEMSQIMGAPIFERLIADQSFQTSNIERIKQIAFHMKNNPNEWNGLGYLNSSDPAEWGSILHRILKITKLSGSTYTKIVEFIKVLSTNWSKSIPEMLKSLSQYSISVDVFFDLEKMVTYEFASLLNDVNILQQELLCNKNYDISSFASKLSHAFLPSVVYQLEEFGLPRMISKKIHINRIIDLCDEELNIHKAIELFHKIGMEKILAQADLKGFDEYILKYFYDGITINAKKR